MSCQTCELAMRVYGFAFFSVAFSLLVDFIYRQWNKYQDWKRCKLTRTHVFNEY